MRRDRDTEGGGLDVTRVGFVVSFALPWGACTPTREIRGGVRALQEEAQGRHPQVRTGAPEAHYSPIGSSYPSSDRRSFHRRIVRGSRSSFRDAPRIVAAFSPCTYFTSAW